MGRSASSSKRVVLELFGEKPVMMFFAPVLRGDAASWFLAVLLALACWAFRDRI